MSQYEIWPGAEERIGDDGLILGSGSVPAPVAACFASLEKLGKIEVPLGKKTRAYDVFLGRGLKSWPPPPVVKKEVAKP
jgi:hypothetical protein